MPEFFVLTDADGNVLDIVEGAGKLAQAIADNYGGPRINPDDDAELLDDLVLDALMAEQRDLDGFADELAGFDPAYETPAFDERLTVYDDDLDAWRGPDSEPLGGDLHTGPYPQGVFPTPEDLADTIKAALQQQDAGDECQCAACKSRPTRFTVPTGATRGSVVASIAWDPSEEDTDPFTRVLRQADELERHPGWSQAARDRKFRDEWSARRKERQEAEQAQQAAAYFAEQQERASRRRNGGILVLWTDTPGKVGATPLYSISHWGAHP